MVPPPSAIPHTCGSAPTVASQPHPQLLLRLRLPLLLLRLLRLLRLRLWLLLAVACFLLPRLSLRPFLWLRLGLRRPRPRLLLQLLLRRWLGLLRRLRLRLRPRSLRSLPPPSRSRRPRSSLRSRSSRRPTRPFMSSTFTANFLPEFFCWVGVQLHVKTHAVPTIQLFDAAVQDGVYVNEEVTGLGIVWRDETIALLLDPGRDNASVGPSPQHRCRAGTSQRLS
mmetsp:Transcript_102954/g.327258  ORF Transcript_102954/g.327258 Transcript_102954/m.327258 type:complete len:224 (-) Transcript_102954:19-690(-)